MGSRPTAQYLMKSELCVRGNLVKLCRPCKFHTLLTDLRVPLLRASSLSRSTRQEASADAAVVIHKVIIWTGMIRRLPRGQEGFTAGAVSGQVALSKCRRPALISLNTSGCFPVSLLVLLMISIDKFVSDRSTSDHPSSLSFSKELLQQRYGSLNAGGLDLNETLTTLLSHRSVRKYADKPLPPDTLNLLCAAARSASSSSNLQAWSVIAVQDQRRKERLAQLAGNQEHIRRCPLFLVWLADLARLRSMAERRGLPAESLSYMETFLVAAIDAALAAQNAAVAAESLGMGIVFIGGMRNQPEAVAQELVLPESTFAVFGMCVGFPDPEKPAAIKPRLPTAAVLHHEVYDAGAQEEVIAEYNATMDRFYSDQQMKTHGNWETHSLNRVRGPEAMQGRHRLVEALNRLGFELR